MRHPALRAPAVSVDPGASLGVLCTLGYSGLRGADDLRALLHDTPVDTIVDVRLSPYSGNRAFSTGMRRTVEAAGFAYVHIPDLGNLAYKTGGTQIRNLEAIEAVLMMLRAGQSVALLCVCAQPKDCHRWTLAQAALDREPALRVVHLLTRPEPGLTTPQPTHASASTD